MNMEAAYGGETQFCIFSAFVVFASFGKFFIRLNA